MNQDYWLRLAVIDHRQLELPGTRPEQWFDFEGDITAFIPAIQSSEKKDAPFCGTKAPSSLDLNEDKTSIEAAWADFMSCTPAYFYYTPTEILEALQYATKHGYSPGKDEKIFANIRNLPPNKLLVKVLAIY